jgi:hypothetical protein
MGRFRNPRYAPESLERRLSPSSLVGHLPPNPVYVGTMHRPTTVPRVTVVSPYTTYSGDPVVTPPGGGSGSGSGGPG